MKAICGSTDITSLVGYGYTVERVPQYGASVTTMDGADHTAKIRDVVKLTVPIIPLTTAQLKSLLELFPATGAYVSWTYDDPYTGTERTANMKYDTRRAAIKITYKGGAQYWEGLVLQLTEQ